MARWLIITFLEVYSICATIARFRMRAEKQFSGQNSFKADIGRRVYSICQFQPVIVFILGINAFADRIDRDASADD